MVELKRISGELIGTGDSVKQIAEANWRDLRAANLCRAEIVGGNLTGADLRGADFRDAYMLGVDFRNADMRESDLRDAEFWGCGLRAVDFRNADIRCAALCAADIWGANLRGAIINWMSRDIIAEILRQAAGNDAEKRAVAGLILISRDWCWKEFLALGHPLQQWALEVLKPWDVPDNPMPWEGK